MSDSAINMHKRIAMGENVTGMKKGGSAKRPGKAVAAKSPAAKKGPRLSRAK